MNYYNEHDLFAAAWLRELIADNQIPRGEVDERSIIDVQPRDLAGFTQCHFFAGIGGWPYALRLAEWPEDRPIWTGSCPCQPFSSAGKQKGLADERHLWPVWFRLIRECQPPVVFGEQVEAAVRHGWLDGVFGDLEAEGYACGAAVLGAHSVSAPHIRQRLYWVADANQPCSDRRTRSRQQPIRGQDREDGGGVAQSEGTEQRWRLEYKSRNRSKETGPGANDSPRGSCIAVGRLGNAESNGRDARRPESGRPRRPSEAGCVCGLALAESEQVGRTGQPRQDGAWSDFDLIPCADGKVRRVEPGTFPLVARLSETVVPSGDPSLSYVQATAEGRQMRLRGYGNAIVPQAAAAFIQAYADRLNGKQDGGQGVLGL